MRLLTTLIFSLVSGPFASLALAQESFPSRPVTLVVPFAAGSATDVFARIVSAELRNKLGQPVVVENRPGANGAVAAESVKRAAPDGYTVLMGTTGTASNVWLMKDQRINPIKDFEPVSRLGAISWVIAVSATSPYKTLGDLVTAARAQPGKLSIAHSSAGALITGQTMIKAFKLDMIAVPYKSSPQAMTDLIGGQVNAMAADFASGAGHFSNGAMRPLAVSGKQRSALYPAVPTMHESGVTDFDLVGWFGTFVPVGTPRSVINTLNSKIVEAVAMPSIRPQTDKMGIEPITTTPEGMADFLRREIAKWEIYVRDAGLKPE
jgi:tripartite-type tricarboxylate transporter receptor subunit TctC